MPVNLTTIDDNNDSISSNYRKALIIAIGSYEQKLKSIDFCENDGKEMLNTLTELGYSISDNHKLIGKVDSNNLKNAILDFFLNENNKADDTLVFYYSGHGVPDNEGEVYLASSDINPDFPLGKGFSFDDLTKVMIRCVSLRQVTILDCCYSGAAKISKSPGDNDKDAEVKETSLSYSIINKESKKIEQGEGRYLLAASQGYQEAYDLKEMGHSIFTYFLLEGLRGKSKDAVDDEGNVTPDTLGRFIYRQIGNLPSEKRPKQIPITKGESAGDIILTTYTHLGKDALKNIGSIVNEGMQHFENGDYDYARTLFDKAIEINPTNPILYSYKGDIFYKEKKYEDAIECYNKALKFNPKYVDVLKDKGSCLDHLGKYEDAIECYNKALDISPTNFDIYIYKGTIYEDLKNFEKALECYNKAISLDPNNKYAKIRKQSVLELISKPDKIQSTVTNKEKYSLISEWDPSSKWLLDGGYCIEVDLSNFLYVTYDGGHIIKKYDMNGKHLKTFGQNIDRKYILGNVGKLLSAVALNKLTFGRKNADMVESGIIDFAVDYQGNIFTLISETKGTESLVTNEKYYVRKFDCDGNFSERWLVDCQPISKNHGYSNGCIVVDSCRDIYVSSGETIYKYNSVGKLLTKWTVEDSVNGEILSIACINGNSSKYVNEPIKDSIYINLRKENLLQIIKYDSKGKFITKWNVKSIKLVDDLKSDISVDSLGNIYMTIIPGNTIYKYNSEGKLLTKWTVNTSEWTDNTYQKKRGLNITVDLSGENVYALIRFGGRVQRFHRSQ